MGASGYRRVRWLLAVVAMSVFVGCGGGGQSDQRLGEFTIYVHGGSLLPRAGEDALIEGVLATREGCVLIERDDGDSYPVVWPSGTSIIDDDPLTLELPGGDHLEVGQRVSGGGGGHDATSERVEVDIDASCLGDSGSVMVFNPDEKLTVR